jgi:glyoxylase-like metal-dependent hydrolase (beta-lactamase superfamily II)
VQIDCLALGDFETNCYVVRSSAAEKSCLIIDPGFSAEPLIEFLRENSLRPQRVLLTHGHCDHIAGLALLYEEYNPLPVCISSQDASMLTDDMQNLSMMMGLSLQLKPADERINSGDTITLGSLSFTVLPTPGHTPGGVSFYNAENGVVFTGDALFAGSIGRDDFPGGDRQILLDGIRKQLFILPDETRAYPGHGPQTTVGIEKRSNPFLT